MTRTVIVGDVHGCAGELEALLEHVRFGSADRLVMVGDLVVRGPDSHGVLAIAKRLGARVALGNHERKLLSSRRRGRANAPDSAQLHLPTRLDAALSEEEWGVLAAMPLWVDLPEHGVRVVHAGVVPGLEVDRTPPEALLKIRTVDARGRWSDEPDAGPLWGTLYTGPPHVVFGHNARVEPQLHPWATGIDTGCVYGGRLSALVLDEGETLARAGRRRLESVPASRKYHVAKGGPFAP